MIQDLLNEVEELLHRNPEQAGGYLELLKLIQSGIAKKASRKKDMLEFILGNEQEKSVVPPALENITSSEDEFKVAKKVADPKITKQMLPEEDESYVKSNVYELLDDDPPKLDRMKKPHKMRRRKQKAISPKQRVKRKESTKVASHRLQDMEIKEPSGLLCMFFVIIIITLGVTLLEPQLGAFFYKNAKPNVPTIPHEELPEAALSLIYPIRGHTYHDNTEFQWKVSGVPPYGPTNEFVRVVQCYLYVDQILHFTDVLQLKNDSETIFTLNVNSEITPQHIHNATIQVDIPLLGGETLTLLDQVEYLSTRKNTVQIESPMNHTVYLFDNPIDVKINVPQHIRSSGTLHRLKLVVDGSAYDLENQNDVLSVTGLLPGDHQVSIITMKQGTALGDSTVHFKVVNADVAGFNHFPTKFLLERLEHLDPTSAETIYIQDVLDSRSTNKLET